MTAQHDWVPSMLGHGETMCRNCLVTNREAAVLGMNECPDPQGQRRREMGRNALEQEK